MTTAKRKDWKMLPEDFLHATLIKIKSVGILLMGKSGSGKSDLALRLIENKDAKLVADDIVIISQKGNAVYGAAADNLRGKLEVRGVGIISYPYVKQAKIDLIVHLSENAADIERMPVAHTESILGLEIKQIDLYAKENSAPDKIMAVLRQQNLL